MFIHFTEYFWTKGDPTVQCDPTSKLNGNTMDGSDRFPFPFIEDKN